jgi:hypothetical protein
MKKHRTTIIVNPIEMEGGVDLDLRVREAAKILQHVNTSMTLMIRPDGSFKEYGLIEKASDDTFLYEVTGKEIRLIDSRISG